MDDRTVVHYPMCVAQTETKTGWICRWSAVSKSEENLPLINSSKRRPKQLNCSSSAVIHSGGISILFIVQNVHDNEDVHVFMRSFFFFFNFKSHSQQKDTGRFLRKRPTTNISNAFDLFRLACVGFFFVSFSLHIRCKPFDTMAYHFLYFSRCREIFEKFTVK